MPSTSDERMFWESLWNALLERLQVPVAGIRLSRERARQLGEPVLQALVRRHRDCVDEAEASAEGLSEAAAASKQFVAEERRLSADHERHRDPHDERYEKNLNLPHLQERGPGREFRHPEWGLLDRFLRPFGFQVLRKKGLRDEDGEEVFNETLATLAVVKDGRSRAPIEELLVFEEIIPNFCRRIGFRAIDSIRRKTSQKARPEHLHSLEGMTHEDGAAVQVADSALADPERPDTWRFEDIYRQCREELSTVEWGLLFDLYVAQNYTVKELIADRKKLAFLGIDPAQSNSTKRRRLEEIINPALAKLAEALAV